MRLSFLSVSALALGALGATSCASTTFDTSVTEPPAVAVTTTLPAGPAAELLPRLVVETGLLSNAIGDATGKTEQLEVIHNLWNAVRPEIVDTEGDLAAEEFDGAFILCDRAEQFNRPADADKCFRNVQALGDAYLTRNP